MFRIAIVNSFSWKSETTIDRIKMATQSVAIFFGVPSFAGRESTSVGR
jgi:hypothetical protein